MLEVTTKVLICTKEEWQGLLRGPKGCLKLMDPGIIICDGEVAKFRPINYTMEQILNNDLDPEERKYFKVWRDKVDAQNASKA